ncbi:uncharacterized protein [Littorina saxatilis]|uniref:uncharacterized protein n=1 Tax=Littorina saxatilis TaxID=31220 RepID=UPI0038B55B13
MHSEVMQCCSVLCLCATSSTCSHVTQYVTTFLAPGTPIVTSSSDLLLRIYVSNPKAAPPVNITVDPSNLTFTLEPGDDTHGIVFDGSAALVGSKKQTGAVVVVLTACSAFPTGVVVHGSFKTKKFSNNTVAAFTVLPVTSLGKDYVTVTHCEQNHCFFGIVATQNQTHVNVTLRLRHSNDVTITPSLTYAGVTYEDGEVIHEVLEPFQAMQVLCYVCDMSGSRVTASFPVAVLSGGEFTTVGNSSTSQDTVLEFLPPTRSLGTLHVVAIDTESSGTVKVVAVHAGTLISIPALSNDNYTADDAGESWTLTLPENRVHSTVLTTTLPVLVTLLISHSYDVSDDVRMTLLTPVSQWSKETTYEAVHFFNFEPVNLVLVADFTDLSDCIKIDDELVSDIDETTPLFNPVDGWGEMSVVRVARETGFHHFRLWCDSDSDSCGGRTCKPFWGYMQGMKNTHDRGWALPLGTFSERGQQVRDSSSSFVG